MPCPSLPARTGVPRVLSVACEGATLTRSQWTAAESNGFPVFARARLTRISTGGEPARPWCVAGGEDRRRDH